MNLPAVPELRRHLFEPGRSIPIWHECDVCVIGGSCTGVFAAVRAARLGAKVALVERMGCFGGVATLSLVNVWHSCLDTVFERQIFAGLSLEVIGRLKQRGVVTEREKNPSWAWAFNPQAMQMELDALVIESEVHPFLHTLFAAPYVSEGRLSGVIVENKSGRGVILAKQFIDASGDGDLATRLGLASYHHPTSQPATACAVVSGWSQMEGIDWKGILREHGAEFGIPSGFAWGCAIPGSDNFMLAATRIPSGDFCDGERLTAAEIEGRRQIRALLDLFKKYAPSVNLQLQSLPARIGLRESRHIRSQHRLTGEEILSGVCFEDAIANGSYRVDIHHPDKPGITLRYLDGREEYGRPGYLTVESRWRPLSRENPTFYQVPFRALLPVGCSNLLIAGRMLDADPEAHAAVRVMVNLNQVGEAAGVAAALAVRDGGDAAAVQANVVRSALACGGSIII